MSYSFWSVIHGEQPSAAKWNILGSNDAGIRTFTDLNFTNNTSPKFQNSGASDKDLFYLGSDDYIKFAQIPYDDSGTGGLKEEVFIQTGWGYQVGDGSDEILEQVTLPVQYTTLLGIQAEQIGRRATSAGTPTDVTWFNTGTSAIVANLNEIDDTSASTFWIAQTHLTNTTGLLATNYYGYCWWAWGIA